MTKEEVLKEYFEKIRHKEWANVDNLIYKLANEIDRLSRIEEKLTKENLHDIFTPQQWETGVRK